MTLNNFWRNNFSFSICETSRVSDKQGYQKSYLKKRVDISE
ncbi:hypothetical protein BSUBE1_0699 [Bacillus subtilis E1]|nr:hypothetical protein BSUBE1_0699 [Bacillus subtilis E1]